MGERQGRVEMTAEGGDSGRAKMPRLAVLLSGTGRTLENLLRAIEGGVLAAEIVVVAGSVEGVRGLEIARAAGIPAHVVRRRDFGHDLGFSEAVYATIAPYRPHLIVLAGFLRRLVIPPVWEGRILNIHPALLPESTAAGRGFFGERVHAAVLASGATESGATVHIVDDEYDAGPVVARTTVPVLPGDDAETLAARVFAAECELYPRAIAEYLAGHPELLD
jgi:formyltetrahydrofolate-dependent phosphoribosylglycinamide formyltransferase